MKGTGRERSFICICGGGQGTFLYCFEGSETEPNSPSSANILSLNKYVVSI
jgi:hypothetical protein